MRGVLTEIGSVLSRGLNVATGGSADLTFSARSHRDGLWTEKYIDALFVFLKGEKGHCARWWQEDVRRAHKTVDDDKTIRKRGFAP
jgi:hypothetical protein